MGEEVRMISEKEMQELVGMVERAINWEEALKKLELKEGDILLVNARMVNVDDLAGIRLPFSVPVIPVVPEAGQSLAEAAKVIGKEKITAEDKCLCYFAIKDWDGVHHDQRCRLYNSKIGVGK